MNIKTTSLMASLGLALLVVACSGSKAAAVDTGYTTRTVEVGSFTGIHTNSSVDVAYTQSTDGKQSVEIYAPASEIDRISVAVYNGVLNVGIKSNGKQSVVSGRVKREVRVTAPPVNRLMASSSGDIILKNGLQTDQIELTTNSAGNIAGSNITCATLMAISNSSGDIKLDKVDSDVVTLTSSSGGDITLADVRCTAFSATASSAGDVKATGLTATTVVAHSNSAGDVLLKGKCTTAVLNANSAGDIDASGLAAATFTQTATSTGTVRVPKQ